VVHPTYRHLERAPRLAGLTWRQWVLLVGGALATYLLARMLPLPSPYGVSAGLTLCGTPAAAGLALAASDRHVSITPRLLWRWRQQAAIYLNGT
jgi:hypothetical protein